MPHVEIYWPADAPAEPLHEAEEALRTADIDTVCRLQPVRRGAPVSVLVLLTTSALQPALKTVFERFGGDAYTALQGFVSRLMGRGRASTEEREQKSAPKAVVFESTSNGAQFVFTPGLPEVAYRRAVELVPEGTGAKYVWDDRNRAWLAMT